jgi:uncharacterized membrane protein SpoIIM required for sporulation
MPEAEGGQAAGGAVLQGLGINRKKVYFAHEYGILRVDGTSSPLLLASLVGFIGAFAAIAVLNLDSFIAIGIVLVLLAAPIADEARYRELKKLVASSPDEVRERKGVLFDWPSIESATLTGNKLRFKSSGRPAETFRIDPPDLPRTGETLAARLGPRMTQKGGSRVRSFITSYSVMFVSLFLLSQAFLLFATLTPFFRGEEATYVSLVNSQKQTLQGASPVQELAAIFMNNIQVALISFVPFLGTFTLSVSSYNTGRALQIIAAQINPPLSTSGALAVLYILPHTWVEEIGYPLAGALGYYVLTHWNTVSFTDLSNRWRRGSTKFVLSFGGIALILAFAATLEVIEPSLGVNALLLWLPVLAVGYGLARRWLRVGRVPKST